MIRRTLLTLSAFLLLSGCGEPQPPEFSKLLAYQELKSRCVTDAPESLQVECQQFVTDYDREHELLSKMAEIHEDEHQEQEYIDLASSEALLALKVHANEKLIAKQCQTQMPKIINSNDLNSVDFCLQFSENTLTLKEYNYLQKFAPRFDNNPQYLEYQAKYASEKITEGLRAMNEGKKREAIEAFKLASDAKDPEGTYLVGIIYEEKQIKKAIAWHKKAVAQGVNLSNVNLARLYLRIKLPKQAKMYYTQAAKGGNALAQYRLFKMDTKSKSKKSRKKAQEWLRKSASSNYPQAQYIYGLQMMKHKEFTKAQEWLQKAYDNGMLDAAFFLGKIYFQEESYEKAYGMLSRATDKGEANFMLAQMFEKGLGVKRNSVLAYRYYKKAHEQNHDNHVADMKRMQRKLTKKDRLAARYIGTKAAKKAKATRKRCGPLANEKNVKKAKKNIHIVGVAQKPIKSANGFIVYGEHERLYYIIAPELAKNITPYQSISIKVKTTGKAMRISSDVGALQSVYQFLHLATCK